MVTLVSVNFEKLTVPSGDRGQSGIYLCTFEYVHLLNADSVSCMLPPSFATEHKLTSAFVVCFAEKFCWPLDL